MNYGLKLVYRRLFFIKYVKSFEETSPTTPIFFILSPGVNPLKVIKVILISSIKIPTNELVSI